MDNGMKSAVAENVPEAAGRLSRLPQACRRPQDVCRGCRKRAGSRRTFVAVAASMPEAAGRLSRLPQACQTSREGIRSCGKHAGRRGTKASVAANAKPDADGSGMLSGRAADIVVVFETDIFTDGRLMMVRHIWVQIYCFFIIIRQKKYFF
jgi:hypothetical protein